MNNFSFCLGVVSENGYYPLGSKEEVLDSRTNSFLPGQLIMPDFKLLSIFICAKELGLTPEQFAEIWFYT